MMKNVVLSIWIFKEAKAVKTLLDTHYSFLNKSFQVYVEDDNGILIEYDIIKAINFNGSISGTTAVLVYTENLFGNRSLKK